MLFSRILLSIMGAMIFFHAKASERAVRDIAREMEVPFVPKSYKFSFSPSDKTVTMVFDERERVTDDLAVIGVQSSYASSAKIIECGSLADVTLMVKSGSLGAQEKSFFKFFIDTDTQRLAVQTLHTPQDVLLNFSGFSMHFGSFQDNRDRVDSTLQNTDTSWASFSDVDQGIYCSSVVMPGKLWVCAQSVSMDWVDMQCNWLRCDTQAPFTFGSLYHKDLSLKGPPRASLETLSYGFSTQSRLQVTTDLILCAPHYRFVSGQVQAFEIYLMDSFDVHILWLVGLRTPQKKTLRFKDYIIESIENQGASLKSTLSFWFTAKTLKHQDQVREIAVGSQKYYVPLSPAPFTDCPEFYCDFDRIDVKAKHLENFTLKNKKMYTQLNRELRRQNKEANIVDNFYAYKGYYKDDIVETVLKDQQGDLSSSSLNEGDFYENFNVIKSSTEDALSRLKALRTFDSGKFITRLRGHKQSFQCTPDSSDFWSLLIPFQDSIYTNGEEGDLCRYYVWDKETNDIDVYDTKGQHVGCLNPMTGVVYHAGISGRCISIAQ